MNIWKRFLSLALVLALVLSMGPIIPFVQANAEAELVSATYTGGEHDAAKWTTSGTGAYVSENFANGYIEVEFAISGAISNAANVFVRSPKTAGGVIFGQEDEIMFRWSVVADSSQTGYTHKATSTLVIRDNAAPGYKLAGNNSVHGTAKTVYLNIQDGAPATLKVKLEIIGNLLRIYVNDALHQEAVFDPQYPIASQEGYFGYYGTSSAATVTQATVQELQVYEVSTQQYICADSTAHLVNPTTMGAAFGRTAYAAYEVGKQVTLSVTDATCVDANTLAVKTASGADVTVTNGKFTMPAEGVSVTGTRLDTAANQEVYNNTGKTAFSSADGWNNSKKFNETFDSTYSYKMTDGSVELKYTLTETIPTGSNPQYQIKLVTTSGLSIEGTLLYQINNANDLYFRLGVRGSTEYGTNKGFVQVDALNIKSYNGSNPNSSVWGKQVTMKLRKVGNFVEFDVSVDGLAGVSKTMRCTLKDVLADEEFTIYVQNLNTAATFDSIKVNRFNRPAQITLDPSAEGLVTLPAYNDPAKTSFVRDEFQVGETIALSVIDGYNYYANGEKIEDPANFVIPDAETVTIAAVVPERELYSATYAGGTLDTDLWVASKSFTTSADGITSGGNTGVVRYKSAFVNGYVEADFIISGDFSYSANLFVRSPNNASGLSGEDEITLRWMSAADTTKEGYTHKLSGEIVFRDSNGETGKSYKLASTALRYHGQTHYINVPQGGAATVKVKMEIVGNLLCAYVDGSKIIEVALNPDYDVASQAGYFGFGFYNDSSNLKVNNVTVQEVKTYSVQTVDGVELSKVADMVITNNSWARTEFVAGETVTLKLDEAEMDGSTLKVNGGAVAVSGGSGTYTFTMPEGDATVTCDEYVAYSITENVDNLSVDKTEAPAGATVTITLDESRLNVATLKVNGGDVEVTGSEGVYTFLMPGNAVTITCSALELAATQVIYTNDGTKALSSKLWSKDVALTSGKLTGAIEAKYNTQMENGWISVTLQMPETHVTPSSLQQILIEVIAPDLKNDIEFGILNWNNSNGVRLRGYTRLNVGGTSSGYDGTTYVDENKAVTDMTTLWGKEVTLSIYKIGNAVMVKAVCDELNMNWGYTYTIDVTSVLGQEDNFQFGISMPSVSGMYITGIEVGRINTAVAVSIDSDLVTIPAVRDLKTTTKYNARTAYMVGETIALGVDATADLATLKANGEVIADPAVFEIPDAETVTVTCDALALPDNQTLYTNNGDKALSSDLWSDPISLTDGKLTGKIESKYKTAIKDGWFSVSLQMPETLPTADNQQVVIEAIETKTNMQIEFGLLYHKTNGMQYRCYLRPSVNTNYGTTNNSIMVFGVANTNISGDLSGKELTMSIRKVGNYFELHISADGVIDQIHTFTLGDILSTADNSVLSAIDTAEFQFGMSWGAFGEMSVSSIEIGRMNEVVTVTVDSSSKDLVSLPKFADPKDTKVLRERTAYQIGETIKLDVSGNAKNVKANGVAVPNPKAFQVNEDVVITAELDTDPYYIAADAILQHNDPGTVGGTKEWKLPAADYTATVGTGYVVSTSITVHKQIMADGTVRSDFPWHGVEVNKIDFRVRPSSNESNTYYLGIRYGGAWVASDDGVVAAAAMTSSVTVPGDKIVGADGQVTYNQAVKVENGVYTLYINGYAVCTYTNAAATKGDVRLWSAKNGTEGTDDGSKWGFTVNYADLRIDRIGSVDEIVFGQKQLALDEDLALDFYIALPEGSTATTATITLDGEQIAAVTLADTKRAGLAEGSIGNGEYMVGWYSWHVVTANVPVKHVGSNIVITLDDGTSPYTYSVAQYAEWLVANSGDAKVFATAKALLDYGAAAHKYFVERDTDETVADPIYKNDLTNVTVPDDYKPIRDGVNEYISLYGCSLEAVEKTNITMYFKVSPTSDWNKDNVSVTTATGDPVGNVTVTNANNGYMRVTITGIHAAALDEVYTVTVASETGNLTVSYSGLSYAYTALNSNVSDNLKTMAKALYNYWAAAQAMN